MHIQCGWRSSILCRNQNELSKQKTEEVQGANFGLLLCENEKISWSYAHVSSGNMYIIVGQNGLFSWFWCHLSPFCPY
jgi:hypothetical protein